MREIILMRSVCAMACYWLIAVCVLLVFSVIMTVFANGIFGKDLGQKVQLCQGNYLTEDQGKNQLAEFAASSSMMNTQFSQML